MGSRIVIQLFRVFLVHGEHLVEDDFVLAVETGDLRDQGIKFCRVMRRGRINQRCQSLITVGEPGVVVVFH